MLADALHTPRRRPQTRVGVQHHITYAAVFMALFWGGGRIANIAITLN